jgi:putative endonuclease
MRKRDWVVYLIRCSDESVYCGITNNLEKRLASHNSGKGSKYTRSRRPVELVAAAAEMTKNDALKLEYRIKQISADKKIIEIEKRKGKTTMNIKNELKKVNDRIKGLAKTIEKLMAAAVKLEKPGKEKPAKKSVIKKSVSKKAPAKKAAPKKADVKKAAEKKPVSREKTMEIQAKGTAVETVLELIKESPNGANSAELMEKTGYNEKKIQNLVFKLRKQGKVKSVSKGVYVIA